MKPNPIKMKTRSNILFFREKQQKIFSRKTVPLGSRRNNKRVGARMVLKMEGGLVLFGVADEGQHVDSPQDN